MSGADLATPELPGPRILVALGMPGCGKTTWSLERWFTWPRAVALDTRQVRGVGEYPGRIVTTPKELAAALRELAGKERWRLTYRGPLYSAKLDPPEAQLGTSFETVFRALALLEHVLVVVDEGDKCCTAQYTPEGLYSIAHYGRRLGQAATVCARRAANIPRDLTTTADEVAAWPVDEPADRRYLADRGFDVELLDTLRNHSALVRRRLEDGTSSFRVERLALPADNAAPSAEALMHVVVALVTLAFVVAVAVMLLMSFDWTRNAIGLGGQTPTGVPGWVAAKTATKAVA
jgi:hypothetical protein